MRVESIPKHELKAIRGIPMSIENRPFVAVPVDVLRVLLAASAAAGPVLSAIPPGSVEAGPFMRNMIAEDLRAARGEAKLTQGDLALKMKVSQTRVSMAESGAEKVSLAFVKRWLKACGLPEDWKPATGQN